MGGGGGDVDGMGAGYGVKEGGGERGVRVLDSATITEEGEVTIFHYVDLCYHF